MVEGHPGTHTVHAERRRVHAAVVASLSPRCISWRIFPGSAPRARHEPGALVRAARSYVGDAQIVIASNREPYQHVSTPSGIEVVRSAGGLASALDSVARATGATWVAQGAADADRIVCDASGRIRVPPGSERYTLQRLWLSPESQALEYRRVCNRCLRPPCLIVFLRPPFPGAPRRP